MSVALELAVIQAISGGLRAEEALAILASVEEALAVLEREGVKP